MSEPLPDPAPDDNPFFLVLASIAAVIGLAVVLLVLVFRPAGRAPATAPSSRPAGLSGPVTPSAYAARNAFADNMARAAMFVARSGLSGWNSRKARAPRGRCTPCEGRPAFIGTRTVPVSPAQYFQPRAGVT
jgi:hypothetical protein